MKAPICTFILLLAMPVMSSASSITNGGFEAGNLGGWSAAGDVAVIGSFSTTHFGTPVTIAPTEGSFQAALSNGPTDSGSCNVTPLSCFTFSGHSSVGFSVGGAPIPSILGVSSQSLADYAHTLYPFGCPAQPGICPFNGSAIGQSFFGNAGDILSFDVHSLTFDGIDMAVVTLDGSIIKPGMVTLATTGIHQLGFGVFNNIDDELPSVLFIDNVTLTSTPEPSTWLLLASGLVGIGLARTFAGTTKRLRLRSLRISCRPVLSAGMEQSF